MKRPIPLILLLTVASALALLNPVGREAESQKISATQSGISRALERTVSGQGAKPALPEPRNPKERELRRLRGKRFDRGGGPLASYPEGVNPDDEDLYWFIEEAPPALPVHDSDLVIIGRVIEQQPYLSANQAGIYTEFNIATERVFKDASTTSPAANEIVAVRDGGFIRLPNGREFKFKVTQMPPAEEGKRYVFFLKHNIPEQDFSILTQYELKDGKVSPTDSYRRELNGKLPFEGWDETSFLAEVERVSM